MNPEPPPAVSAERIPSPSAHYVVHCDCPAPRPAPHGRPAEKPTAPPPPADKTPAGHQKTIAPPDPVGKGTSPLCVMLYWTVV